jgi:glycosyltransferase involved in cell wall biosynthesis
MQLSIIIPAYNEEDRIVRTLNKTLNYLNQQDYSSEVIVVSDGSRDQTRSVVENDFATQEKIILKMLEYHPNRGKGYAVRYGMLKSHGEHVLFMDADYATPIEEVEKGLRLLNDGYDVAIGSRGLANSEVTHHQRFSRALAAQIYTFVQNTYLGFQYKDTQCGFKLFKHSAAQHLFTLQRLDSVIFDPEILWLAGRHGYKVAEFPVCWKHDENSRIQYDTFAKSLFVFQELFKIRQLHRN